MASALLALASLPVRAQPSAADQPAPAVALLPESRGTILLVRTAGDERVMMRVRAELSASAWTVIEVGPDDRTDKAALSALVTSHAATAALRVRPARAELELWVASSAAAGGGNAETLSGDGPRLDDAVLAVRATEALRALGLHVERAVGAAASPSEPAPDAPTAVTDRPAAHSAAAAQDEATDTDMESEPPPPPITRALWLQLAPALVASPGGLPASWDGFASVRLQPSTHASFGVFGLIPCSSNRVRGSEGSSRIATWFVGGAADLLLPLSRRFEWSFGAELAAAIALMHGSAQAPYTSADTHVFALAAMVRTTLHVELGGGLRLFGQLSLGDTFPRIAVRFVSREAAHFGQPFVAGMLGLELALWSRRSP